MTMARGWLMEPKNVSRAIIAVGLTAILAIMLSFTVAVAEVQHRQAEDRLTAQVAADRAASSARYGAVCTVVGLIVGAPTDPKPSTKHGKVQYERLSAELKALDCPPTFPPERTTTP